MSSELGRTGLQVGEVFQFESKFDFENILRHLLCKVAQLEIHSASFTQFSEKSNFRDFDTLMPRGVLFGEFQASQNIPSPKLGMKGTTNLKKLCLSIFYIAVSLEESIIHFSDLLVLRVFIFCPTLKKRQSAGCVKQTFLKYVRMC